MFVTNWISTTKIQKISEITNFLGTISYPELRFLTFKKWCAKILKTNELSKQFG